MRRIAALSLALASLAAAPVVHPDARQAGLIEEAERLATRATSAWDAGRHAEAFTLFAKAMAAEERALGALACPRLGSLDVVAGWHAERRQWDRAIGARKEALGLTRLLHGEKDWRTRDAARQLADVRALAKAPMAKQEAFVRMNASTRKALALQEAGDPRGAVAPLREAARLAAEAFGAGHPTHAATVNNLALALRRASLPKEARPLFEKALAWHRANHGDEHPDVAGTMANLATIHQDLGDYDAALPLFRRAAAIHSRTKSAWDEEAATHWNNLGVLLELRGDRLEAQACLERALAVLKALPGDQSRAVLDAEANLGTLLASAGQYREALALLERVRTARAAAVGEKHPEYAHTLRTLADVHTEMGQYRRALGEYRQALAVFTARLGAGHEETALTLNNLAVLLRTLGDHREATERQQESLNIRLKRLGERHPTTLAAIDNLASIHQEMGRRDEARRLFERGLRVRRATVGVRHPDYLTGLSNLAILLAEEGKVDEALPLLGEALRLCKPGGAHAAHLHHNIGLLRLGAGHHEQAGRHLTLALIGYRQDGGEESQGYMRTLNGLGMLMARSGRPEAAAVALEQALAVASRQLALAGAAQSERQQLAMTVRLREQLDARLALPDPPANPAYPHVLAWKGAVFERQRVRREAGGAEAGELLRDLGRVTCELAAVSLDPLRADPEKARGLARRREAIEARLAGLGADVPRPARRATARELADALPADAALVDFLVYRRGDPGRRVAHVAAWVVRRGAPVRRVDLGPARPIAEAVTAWRKDLQAGGADTRGGKAVRRMVIDPLEAHLGGARTVLLSPDGPLNLVPFAALPGRRSEGYWLEEVALAVVPVPRLLAEKRAASLASSSLTSVGGVDFGGAGKWAGLAAAGLEARRVEGAFRSAFADGARTSLDGRGATKEAVRRALQTHRFAHLATHGFFAEAAGAAHPGVLSGLVLAGANRPAAGEDGILTALEVSELDLSRLELAVLSACETGLGRAAGGEGLQGLQRAFAVAGCRSVVASLWSVHDGATSVLMERLYHHLWEKKLSKIEALRQAQLDLLRNPAWVEGRQAELVKAVPGVRGAGREAVKLPAGARRSPPAWWAAFVLSGDWR